MRYLTFSALLAICGIGAIAAPQEGGKAGGGPPGGKSGAPPSGGKPPGGGKSGGAAGIPSGLFENLAQYQPLLNAVLGQPAKPPSGCSKFEVLFGWCSMRSSLREPISILTSNLQREEHTSLAHMALSLATLCYP
jgi:hypothetical protein